MSDRGPGDGDGVLGASNDATGELGERIGAYSGAGLCGSPMNALDLARLSQNFQILPVPADDDDLETTAKKLEQLAEVVKRGNSLALWTGLKLAPQTPSAESIAMEQMTDAEREIYEAWKKARGKDARESWGDTSSSGDMLRLPQFQWETCVAAVPGGQQSVKKFTQRAEAMDIVFGHEGATPEHASWLTLNMVDILPLIKAVAKVNNTEKHFHSNGDPHLQSLSDVEVAEVQTARRVVAAAERNRTRELEKIRKLTRLISESAAIIKAHGQGLEK